MKVETLNHNKIVWPRVKRAMVSVHILFLFYNEHNEYTYSIFW